MEKSTLALMIFLSASPVHAAQFYKWTDESGKVHYSYNRPVDKAGYAYSKLNETGRTVDEVSLSSESKVDTTAALAKKAAAQKKAEQAKKDQFLLSTYLSIEEFDSKYEEKKAFLMKQVDVYLRRQEDLGNDINEARVSMESERNSSDKELFNKFQSYIEESTDSFEMYSELVDDSYKKIDELELSYQKDRERLAFLLSKK